MKVKEEKHNEMRGGQLTSKQNPGKKSSIRGEETGSTTRSEQDPLKEQSESDTKKVESPKPQKSTDKDEDEENYNYKSPGFKRPEKGDIRKTEPNDLKEAKDDHRVIF